MQVVPEGSEELKLILKRVMQNKHSVCRECEVHDHSVIQESSTSNTLGVTEIGVERNENSNYYGNVGEDEFLGDEDVFLAEI